MYALKPLRSILIVFMVGLFLNSLVPAAAQVGTEENISNPRFSQDGRSLAFGDPASMPQSLAENSQQAPANLLAGHPGLLYVSPDYALSFYEPVTGQIHKLTAPFSGQGFSVSPDGRTMLFGDQIISVQSQADGSVTTSVTAAEQPEEFSSLNWSPDGKNYGYVENGVIWGADISGNHWKVSEGDAAPDWSYDGRWMAFCDREGHLWIAESGKPADWIVQQDHCQVSWSPVQSILAYATFPNGDFTGQANGRAFLYDPLNGNTKEVAQNVSEVDWSPDGILVSIQRITWMGASNYGFSLAAVNPETGQELPIEEFNAEMYGNHGWIQQADGYLVGKYKFQADLLYKEQLADILFDASRDGRRLLVGSGIGQNIQIVCRDVETNIEYPVAEVTLKNLPGVSASFSPDGNNILVSNDEIGKTIDWIAGCGPGASRQFETLALPYQQYFSPDGSWLVMEGTNATGEQNAKIALRGLEGDQIREVPAGLQTRTAWFQMPETPVATSAAASMGIPPVVSPEPSTVGASVHLQENMPGNGVVMFSLLLWAGALVAIVILMLYLWRNWSIPRKIEKDPVSEPPIEAIAFQVAAPAPETSPQEVEKAFQEGVNLVRAGKASDGIVELTKVIQAEPGNNVAWFWLGIASARLKDKRSAERCFLQAKQHGHPEADQALAWLRQQEG
jgi:Tol biopolymer transport system component